MEVEVTLEATFRTTTKTTDTLRRRLIRLLRENDFDEKNFEFSIKRIKAKSVEEKYESTKDKGKKRAKSKISRRRSRK